jgi:RNAse (barnase) inhibitor barstar
MIGYLTALVTGASPPGRYRLAVPAPVRAIRDELVTAGWMMRIVDGIAMVDRASLFDEFATACDFPDWFGGNWDAFADCLRDLSWLPSDPIAILWQRSGAVDPELRHDAGRVIDAAIAARVAVDLPALCVIYPAGAGRDAGGRDAGGRGDADPDDAVSGDGGPMLRPVR